MLGSAAQNTIVLADNIFLYHKSAVEFATIGIIGVFYLVLATIGYGISRGGQIIIARRYGENKLDHVKRSFYALVFLEILMALFLFTFIQTSGRWFLGLFIDSAEILDLSLQYLIPRSYGLFFSYVGVAIIGLYTGIAKTKFIIWDMLLLMVINICLNYILIFGRYGFPEMGIAGAAWASTIAEIVAFIVFVIYMIYDKDIKKFRIFEFVTVSRSEILGVYKISTPMIAQAILGIGSWFIFFSLVENLGLRQLELSNLIRNVYLLLSIPCWGFSAGINTHVSNFIGQGRRAAVFPIIKKTMYANLLITMAIAVPVIWQPDIFLYPLFGGTDMSLISEAGNLFWVLLVIMLIFSIGGTFFNGLLGTGATQVGLWIQGGCALVYLIYIYVSIKILQADVVWAWGSEILYWSLILILSIVYLRSNKWHQLNV